MGRKKKWKSAYLNNSTYLDYYYRLKNLALNVFKWENLPDTVDERFLELTLFEKGYLLYFNDEDIGDIALTCTIGGELNIYNIPKRRTAYSTSGYRRNMNEDNSVLIFNNFLHMPTESTIRLFALRLYEIERAIDVNIKGQKTPILILCDEQQRLTMQNLYMQYDGNEPFIFGDKNLGVTGVSSLKTDAPFVSDKLLVLKHQILNEALTFCGIENSNADKRERLVADEVGSNYGQVEAQRNVMLNARRQACEQINAMFGTDIWVNFRSNLDTKVNVESIRNNPLFDLEDIEDE